MDTNWDLKSKKIWTVLPAAPGKDITLSTVAIDEYVERFRLRVQKYLWKLLSSENSERQRGNPLLDIEVSGYQILWNKSVH